MIENIAIAVGAVFACLLVVLKLWVSANSKKKQEQAESEKLIEKSKVSGDPQDVLEAFDKLNRSN